ncbi:protein tyrosine phosphatase-like protein [Colletotrichum higginsianum]|uniref:Very-long-chain (3R)-3-hydroxyacyl-CoA dehydratase n=2 Tax=Colletotrichum higginsianum TaxID=80884 RepID=H1VVJ1_COLHI|nr:Protein tyrosine phosphatase-like protein [Colletotrichum higginsianum IMI 349063]OBR15095.1 Protein tyrosine phosphatase-like protein [Colletotrichum higginsianum IMI 349063]TID04273.1 Very-long-chain (3R)-3-hydroxyacyl-CoA dehydratase PASTICCINO 2 [Colletotrichum higginsianum]CCF44251.1 protein tyrosine phosphatase-like protein [Colletotrichum higginsianum]
MAEKHQTNAAGARTVYLTIYNALFASLWASILYTVVTTAASGGKLAVYDAAEARARWVQTLTLIEVVHSAVGLVRSPVSTTAIQVVARTIIVWMVCYSFPESTAPSAAYVALLLSWAVADTVRYAYLALNLHGKASDALVWLRYTMFYPLYPIGISSEFWLLYLAIEPASRVSAVLPPIFYFCLCLYVPGSYTMYTYMIKQRKKTLSRSSKSQ